MQGVHQISSHTNRLTTVKTDRQEQDHTGLKRWIEFWTGKSRPTSDQKAHRGPSSPTH